MIGDCIGLVDGDGTASWVWDSIGRLRSHTDPLAGTVAYGYSDAGPATSVTYPGGKTVSLDYDADTRPSTLEAWVGGPVGFGWDPASNLVSIDTAATPGVESSFDFDRANRLSGMTLREGTTQIGGLCYQATSVVEDCATPPSDARTYQYDSLGDRITETGADGGTRLFGYDQASRLVEASVRDGRGGYHPVSPARILDTRATSRMGTCEPHCGTFVANEAKLVRVNDLAGVPAAGVGAVVLNVTTLGASSAGYVKVNKDPNGHSAAGTVRIQPGESTNLLVIAAVDAEGRVSIFSDQVTDVVVSVNGWYSSSDGMSGSSFTTVAPDRILDTRVPTGVCDGGTCGRSSAGQTRRLLVSGVGDVPASGVSAVYVTVFAVNPASAGYLRLNTNAGGTASGDFTINYQPGTNAGTGIAQVASDGTVAIYTSEATDLVVDVSGWFGASGLGAHYVPTEPARLADTRTGSTQGTCDPSPCSRISSGTTMKVKVTGLAGVPASGTDAVVMDLTSISAGTGYLRVGHNSATNASIATLHAGDRHTDSAAVIATPDPDGYVTFHAVGADFDVFANATGYFAKPEWRYSYSGDGLRRTKTGPDGTTTTFTWDRSGPLPLLLAETIDAVGTNYDKVVRYIYGPSGRVLADITQPASGPEVLRWYHHDQLGSTRALTDTSGAVIGAFAYTPFGQPTGATGTDTTPIGWAGEYTDEETGFVYLRARYYDPATGQFLTRDPLEALTRSAYGYVGNNPINVTDPTGLAPWDGIVDFFVGSGCDGDGLFGAIGSISDQDIANFAGGVLNTITFGNGNTVAGWAGVEDRYDTSSGWYTVGEIAGFAVPIGGAGSAWKAGNEVRIGRNLRFAPWGNRTGHSLGRWPHYHRRGIDGVTGLTRDGQGIGRHRPWERMSPDRSFWDRF